MGYYCSACNKPITSAEFAYSKKYYDRPLCRSCQTRARARKQNDDLDIGDVIKGAQNVLKGVSKVVKERSIIGERDFNKWITDWRRPRKNLDFSLENKHFFLGGPDLDDFTKLIMNEAQNSILIANPFIEECYLTDILKENANKRIEIKVVTREPYQDKKKTECHSNLREKGIDLKLDKRIHSKIIVIDNKVVVVSSMNFYSGSSGGASNEAGIVSIDEKVVDSAASYIRQFF